MSPTWPKPLPSVNGRLEVLHSAGLGRDAICEANKRGVRALGQWRLARRRRRSWAETNVGRSRRHAEGETIVAGDPSSGDRQRKFRAIGTDKARRTSVPRQPLRKGQREIDAFRCIP